MMTDEERQKLCDDLRQVYRYINNDEINELIWRAADEIERLAQENAKLRAENQMLWSILPEGTTVINPVEKSK